MRNARFDLQTFRISETVMSFKRSAYKRYPVSVLCTHMSKKVVDFEVKSAVCRPCNVVSAVIRPLPAVPGPGGSNDGLVPRIFLHLGVDPCADCCPASPHVQSCR